MKKQLYRYLIAVIAITIGNHAHIHAEIVKLAFKAVDQGEVITFDGEAEEITPGMTVGDLKRELPTLTVRFAPLDYAYGVSDLKPENFEVLVDNMPLKDGDPISSAKALSVIVSRQVIVPVTFVRVDDQGKPVFSHQLQVATSDITTKFKENILEAAFNQIATEDNWDLSLGGNAELISLQSSDGRAIEGAKDAKFHGPLIAVYQKPFVSFGADTKATMQRERIGMPAPMPVEQGLADSVFQPSDHARVQPEPAAAPAQQETSAAQSPERARVQPGLAQTPMPVEQGLADSVFQPSDRTRVQPEPAAAPAQQEPSAVQSPERVRVQPEPTAAPAPQPQSAPAPAPQGRFKIIKATYGWKNDVADITQKLQNEVNSTGRLHIPKNMNTWVGHDPKQGKVKITTVEFETTDAQRLETTAWWKKAFSKGVLHHISGNKYKLEVDENSEYTL